MKLISCEIHIWSCSKSERELILYHAFFFRFRPNSFHPVVKWKCPFSIRDCEGTTYLNLNNFVRDRTIRITSRNSNDVGERFLNTLSILALSGNAVISTSHNNFDAVFFFKFRKWQKFSIHVARFSNDCMHLNDTRIPVPLNIP